MRRWGAGIRGQVDGPAPGQEGPCFCRGLQFVSHSPSLGAHERCVEGRTHSHIFVLERPLWNSRGLDCRGARLES